MEQIRVVLVDDQQLFRSGVAVIIDAQSDMKVVGQASDGAQAFDVIRDTKPDIALVDVRMHPVDGVELVRRLFRGKAAPRVIMLTTFNLDDRAAQAIRYGASGFLLKDATPEFLCESIRTVHRGAAVLAPQDLELLLGGGLKARTIPKEFAALTAKEREVFDVVAAGLNNGEIAASLFMSESTVKTHVGAILRKLDLRDRVQVVVYAHDHGLEAQV